MIKPETELDYFGRLVDAFADLLRRERRTVVTYDEVRGWLGERLGKPPSHTSVIRWMKGTRPDDGDTQLALADVLGVEHAWLFLNRGPRVRLAEPTASEVPSVRMDTGVEVLNTVTDSTTAAPEAGGRRRGEGK